MKDVEERGPRIPSWLRKPTFDRISRGEARRAVRGLHTVCEEARCPNRGECLGGQATATFLILGPGCSRDCGFCSVASNPVPPEPSEPERVAASARELNLSYVVITSPTRDDLPGGGARYFAETVEKTRRVLPETGVEVLVPDFEGSYEAVDIVLAAGVDVFAHNVETVRRMYPRVRPGADYERSLGLLKYAAGKGTVCKSALVLGMGETDEEVYATLDDVATAGVRIIVIGQYMRPTAAHVAVARYLTPGDFARFEDAALTAGFTAVAAGPYVRSSYRAAELAERTRRTVIA